MHPFRQHGFRIRRWVLPAILLVVAGCQPPREPVTETGVAPPPPPPEVPAVRDLDRVPAEVLARLHEAGAGGGDLTLVDIWAPWERGSAAETAAIAALGERLGNEGLSLVGLALPDPPTAAGEAVATVVPEPGYPVLAATPELQQAVGGVRAIPTRLLLDGEGRVLARFSGFVEQDVLEAEIRKRLAAPPAGTN